MGEQISMRALGRRKSHRDFHVFTKGQEKRPSQEGREGHCDLFSIGIERNEGKEEAHTFAISDIMSIMVTPIIRTQMAPSP